MPRLLASHRATALRRSLCVGSPASFGDCVKHKLDFRARKAGDLRIELEIRERTQLDGERATIPAGVEGELIVGQRIGPALRRIEARKAKRRHAFQAQKLSGLQAAMPGDDFVVIVDEDRIGEAEPGDAVGDLPDLLFGMRAGIAGKRPQARDRHRLDGQGFHLRRP